MPFQKGNKFGGQKPRGSQSHRTKFIAGLKANSSSEKDFIAKILAMAAEGNTTSLNIASTRLWKESKATLPLFELPEAETKEEHATNIITAMVSGQMTADQASTAMSVLRGASELTEVAELLAMVKELEGK